MRVLTFFRQMRNFRSARLVGGQVIANGPVSRRSKREPVNQQVADEKLKFDMCGSGLRKGCAGKIGATPVRSRAASWTTCVLAVGGCHWPFGRHGSYWWSSEYVIFLGWIGGWRDICQDWPTIKGGYTAQSDMLAADESAMGCGQTCMLGNWRLCDNLMADGRGWTIWGIDRHATMRRLSYLCVFRL